METTGHNGPDTLGGALRQYTDHLGTRACVLPRLDPDLRPVMAAAQIYAEAGPASVGFMLVAR